MKPNRASAVALSVLGVVEHVGLAIIVLATIVAGHREVMVMIENGEVTLADLLLMFLYLEILAMVAGYYQSGKLPVRIPIYIAIVALARYLVLDMKEMDIWRLLGIALAMTLLSLAVLVIRYGHCRFPYDEPDGLSVARLFSPRRQTKP